MWVGLFMSYVCEFVSELLWLYGEGFGEEELRKLGFFF